MRKTAGTNSKMTQMLELYYKNYYKNALSSKRQYFLKEWKDRKLQQRNRGIK